MPFLQEYNCFYFGSQFFYCEIRCNINGFVELSEIFSSLCRMHIFLHIQGQLIG
jgi:hypothetical protein